MSPLAYFLLSTVVTAITGVVCYLRGKIDFVEDHRDMLRLSGLLMGKMLERDHEGGLVVLLRWQDTDDEPRVRMQCFDFDGELDEVEPGQVELDIADG